MLIDLIDYLSSLYSDSDSWVPKNQGAAYEDILFSGTGPTDNRNLVDETCCRCLLYIHHGKKRARIFDTVGELVEYLIVKK